MKTALEQLIDKIIEFGQKCASEGDSDGAMMCAEIHVEAEDLLPTEKQQIIDAYHASECDSWSEKAMEQLGIDRDDKTNGEQYYTQTFKDK